MNKILIKYYTEHLMLLLDYFYEKKLFIDFFTLSLEAVHFFF